MKSLNLLGSLPTKQELSHDLRSAVISIAWKVFHVLFSWWDKSLEKTSKGYMKKTHTTINVDDNSTRTIEELKESWKGIIISNHKSGVFSDYLPLFATLWDDVLNKSIFYTGSYNLTMNQREFPEYEFRPATLRTREDVIKLKDQIKNDVEKINSNWWYIFIIPSWANTSEDAEFQAIFQRMIKQAADDLPVLVSHIEHDSSRWYKQIAESMMKWVKSETTITSKLQSAKDWKNDNWKAMKWDEMRAKYNKDTKE